MRKNFNFAQSKQTCMKKKTKAIFFYVILALLILCSCKNKSNCTVSQNGSNIKISANEVNSDTTFNLDLSSVFDLSNSFELELLGSWEWGRFFLPLFSFKLAIYPHNDEIVRAERVVHYYPSIWHDSQSVYLYNHGYSSIKELEVRDDYIYYYEEDKSSLRNDTNYVRHFLSISKQDIIDAINETPGKEDLLKYANEYSQGDFIEKHYEPFDIVPEKEEIKVYYRIDGEDIVKSFYTIHSVRHR